jgi:hypothetical protein
MSFFIIAAVLVWEAYKASVNGANYWRIGLYLIAAMAAVSLGIAGTREKHRREDLK